MIQFVFKPRRKVNGKSRAARLYSGRYRLSGDIRIKTVRLKTTDRQVAEQKLAKLVQQLERERAGLLPPKSLRDWGCKSMRDHLADYLQNLRAIGRDPDYIRNLQYRL